MLLLCSLFSQPSHPPFLLVRGWLSLHFGRHLCWWATGPSLWILPPRPSTTPQHPGCWSVLLYCVLAPLAWLTVMLYLSITSPGVRLMCPCLSTCLVFLCCWPLCKNSDCSFVLPPALTVNCLLDKGCLVFGLFTVAPILAACSDLRMILWIIQSVLVFPDYRKPLDCVTDARQQWPWSSSDQLRLQIPFPVLFRCIIWPWNIALCTKTWGKHIPVGLLALREWGLLKEKETLASYSSWPGNHA